jgi:hypothetical protein
METERFESTCTLRPKREGFITLHTIEALQNSISYLNYKIQENKF